MGSYVYNEENSVENMAPGIYVTLFSQLTNGPTSETCYKYNWFERLARDEHSSLLGPLDEN
jgi:hypothetical protein